MKEYPPQASPEAQAALAQLAGLIADPERRREFSVDARRALDNAGVAHNQLPDELLDRFGGLSLDELTIMAERCEDLMAHGFFAELPDGGRVCLF